MDISNITDINALKVMAYDAIAAKEAAERNLAVINQRIEQLMNGQPGPKDPKAPTEPGADQPANGSAPTAKPADEPAKPE